MFVSKSFSLLSIIPDIPFVSTYISGFILSTIFSISESLDNIMLESYLIISLNCLLGISITESLIPNPVTNSAVHPDIPIIVVIDLFLYLKMFLVVTLFEKLKCFQINGIFYKRIFLPFFGAFGLINCEACSFNSLFATIYVAPPMHINAKSVPIIPDNNLYLHTNPGTA